MRHVDWVFAQCNSTLLSPLTSQRSDFGSNLDSRSSVHCPACSAIGRRGLLTPMLCFAHSTRPKLSLNPDAPPAALTRRPLAPVKLGSLGVSPLVGEVCMLFRSRTAALILIVVG